jgi:phage gp46-like protein
MKSLMDLNELESAVQISITAKARSDGKHGYWGDLLGPVNCGSLLWTFEREHLSPENEVKAKSLSMDSLKYLKGRGFVKSIYASTKTVGGKLILNVALDGRTQDVSL